MKFSDLVRGIQKNTFRYDDGHPDRKANAVSFTMNKIQVEYDDEILVFNSLNKAIGRLAKYETECTITYNGKDGQSVKFMPPSTSSSILGDITKKCKAVAKTLCFPKLEIDVQFNNGCVGDVIFTISYALPIAIMKS